MTRFDSFLDQLRTLDSRPTMREWLVHSTTWEPVDVTESPAEALAAERDRRAV